MNRGKPTSVVLKVSGSTQVPLYLDMLHLMEDPVMEQEIFAEAVKMALSERIGGFDNLTVKPPSGNACDVELNLADLCRKIESINRSYSHVRAHAKVMRELLQELSELQIGKKGSEIDPTDAKGEAAQRHDELVGILKELADRMVEDRLEESDGPVDGKQGFNAVQPHSEEIPSGYRPACDPEPHQEGFDEEARRRMGYAPLGDSSPPGREDGSESNPDDNADENTDTDQEDHHRRPLLESDDMDGDNGEEDDMKNDTENEKPAP